MIFAPPKDIVAFKRFWKLHVAFVVHGEPQQAGSKKAMPVYNRATQQYARAANGRPVVAVTDANTLARPHAAAIAKSAAEALAALGRGLIVDGPLLTMLEFQFQRPKSHYGTGKNAGLLKASAPDLLGVMPDNDKLQRCAHDGMTGVVYRDDGQVAAVLPLKLYGESDVTRIAVYSYAGKAP